MNKKVLVLLLASIGLVTGCSDKQNSATEKAAASSVDQQQKQPQATPSEQTQTGMMSTESGAPIEPPQEIIDEILSDAAKRVRPHTSSDQPPMEYYSQEETPYQQYESNMADETSPEELTDQATANTFTPDETASTPESTPNTSYQNMQAMTSHSNPFGSTENQPEARNTDESDAEENDISSDSNASDTTHTEANPCGDLQRQEQIVAELMGRIMQNDQSINPETVDQEIQRLNELRACQVIGQFDN